ncbi:MFS transporter [Gulosibacter chungangensis]|uniref:MFS transporter n=1 Tax=Gulosibacter chungangensis TaxID=979746 RepID=A0A7J5BAU4_9MICO|nr:MFS transporter [Gulosibacter chungangensis]KAB1642574.1 MFS transporter [Gulosibacter chungangensis]
MTESTAAATPVDLPATAHTPEPGRARRLALVAALYCTQNLSLGFYTYAFLTIAQARGVALASIGAAAGVAMILTLKFLWAPLIDRFGSRKLGHYRGGLIVTQRLLGLGIAALALLDPAADFGVMLRMFAVLFFLAGTQDIAADAAATRLLRPEERGLGNGFQSAGSCVAQVVGGGLVLVVYGFAGWQAAALMLAVFSLLPLPLILAWRESATTQSQPVPHITLRSTLAFFARPAVRLWCFVLLPAYTVGFTIAYTVGFTIVFTISMDLTRPESAGTDFTFFTTVTSILMVIAAGLGLVTADAFGFVAVVLVAGVLALVGLVITVLRIGRVLAAPARAQNLQNSAQVTE